MYTADFTGDNSPRAVFHQSSDVHATEALWYMPPLVPSSRVCRGGGDLAVRECALPLATCGERAVLYIQKSSRYMVINEQYRVFPTSRIGNSYNASFRATESTFVGLSGSGAAASQARRIYSY